MKLIIQFILSEFTYFSAKVVVLGVEQTDESGVDGALVRELDGAVRQDLKDFGFVRGKISLEDAGEAFQVALKRGRALKIDSFFNISDLFSLAPHDSFKF